MAGTYPRVQICDPALLPGAHMVSYSVISRESSLEGEMSEPEEVLSDYQEENNKLLTDTKQT